MKNLSKKTRACQLPLTGLQPVESTSEKQDSSESFAPIDPLCMLSAKRLLDENPDWLDENSDQLPPDLRPRKPPSHNKSYLLLRIQRWLNRQIISRIHKAFKHKKGPTE